MKLTLKELLLSRSALDELNKFKGLKGSIAYKIAKNYKLIKDELEPYTQTEQSIVQKYALRDENGEFRTSKSGEYLFNVDDVKTVQDELESVQSEEVEIDIKVISFDDLENVGLSAEQIMSIEFMLDFGEE